jgi:HSP20 family protein
MLMRRVWPSRPTFESAFDEYDPVRRELLRMLGFVARRDTSAQVESGMFPPINITQDNDHLYVRAEVPGIKAAELSISALRNRLSISGKREIPREHERVSYHRKERAEGAFSRMVTLPTEVDSESVDARYTDGILTVTLAKAEAAKPRQIKVKT